MYEDIHSAKYEDVGYLIIVNLIDDENLIYPLLLQTKMHHFDIFYFIKFNRLSIILMIFLRIARYDYNPYDYNLEKSKRAQLMLIRREAFHPSSPPIPRCPTGLRTAGYYVPDNVR